MTTRRDVLKGVGAAAVAGAMSIDPKPVDADVLKPITASEIVERQMQFSFYAVQQMQAAYAQAVFDPLNQTYSLRRIVPIESLE